MRRLLLAASAIAALAAVTAAAATASPTYTATTVVSGLDNPRDLAFGPDGKLYVAEAGHGGTECVSGGPNGTACFGLTSQISRLDGGTVTPVLQGLISMAAPDGSGATGVDGITWKGDDLFGVITASPAVVPPTGLSDATAAAARAQLGQLIKADFGKNSWDNFAGIGAFDFQWALDHKSLVPDQFPDANPYGVAVGPTATWVVDAASNTLDRVDKHGHIKIAAFVPNPPVSDAVPTCVAIGRNGAIYMGQLTGGGNAPGSAAIWRYTPKTGLKQWATGLTAITGCGFGPDGKFYAVEFSTQGLDAAAPGTGELVLVKPHSTSPTTIVSGLSLPGGFAADSNSVYFSNWSVAPAVSGMGAVMRVQVK